MAQMDALFPSSDESLGRATWESHLGHDQGPIGELMPQLRSFYADEIALLPGNANNYDREFREDRLGDYLLILYIRGELPDDLLEQFWRNAPSRLRQHAMWFLGQQMALPTADLPDVMRARGFSYWERRLAAAVNSMKPDSFRMELGGIGQWHLRDQIDDLWLINQLLAMLRAGFVPTDAFNVVEWLSKVSSRHSDLAAEVLTALLMNPNVDRWAYLTQQECIRAVFKDGLANGTTATITRVEEAISFLSSVGETGYLDLLGAPAAE
jgi:hypothetical protein